jgi:branched-chain amino acid transport system substrate-binding protein
MARVGIFLIIIALIGGTMGCALPSLAQYDLTISSTEGGLVTTPGEGTGSFTYDEGKVVDLVATPDEYYRFVNWTGDVGTVANVSSASTTITMNGDYEITANFEETAPITFAVVGSMTEFHGQEQRDGASMAAEEINDAGGVDISGVKYTVELVEVETKEETEGEDGSTGTANLEAVINDVDFIVGGSRTEVVSVYREVAMDAHKIFMNCGAAAGSLQYWVVEDYDHYKYWFKVTPYNDVFLVTSLYKITQTIGGVLKQRLEGYGEAVAEDYRVPEDGKLRVAILMEDAAWCAQMVTSAQSYLRSYGFTVVGTWLVSPTASDISTELSQIAAVKPHIIFTAFSGPVGVTYSSQRVELGIPAMTIGINVLGELKSHWGDTEGKCNGEIMLDTWAEGLQYAAKTTAFFDAFMAKTGEYPIYTAATYDAIYQLKEAIEATDSLDADDIIQYLETHSYVGVGGSYAYYPMPDIDLGGGVYALSDTQVCALYPSLGAYNQTNWLCAASGGPHIAHDLVYGPGYTTGIGAQWQDGRKVGVWPTYLGPNYNAALTDQYGCWNFKYPGTVDVMIPIQGFLAS